MDLMIWIQSLKLSMFEVLLSATYCTSLQVINEIIL